MKADICYFLDNALLCAFAPSHCTPESEFHVIQTNFMNYVAFIRTSVSAVLAVKVKVNQSRYGPGVTQKVPGS